MRVKNSFVKGLCLFDSINFSHIVSLLFLVRSCLDSCEIFSIMIGTHLAKGQFECNVWSSCGEQFELG